MRISSLGMKDFVLNPIALRKAKIVCNFGFSECSRVKMSVLSDFSCTNFLTVYFYSFRTIC